MRLEASSALEPENGSGFGGRQRNTRQAAAIEAALSESEAFQTAQQLHARVTARGERVGLTTVYRHLNLLSSNGAVDIVHNADGEAQYRMCGVRQRAGVSLHHHHLVCRECGRSVEVGGPEVEAWADRVALEAGYTEVSHTLEVFGRCPAH